MPFHVHIRADEFWDEVAEEFINTPEYDFDIEHSLYAIRKWESKWHKSFLNSKTLSKAEFIDYVRAMTITENIPEEAYYHLTLENQLGIEAYMDDPMTATTVRRKEGQSPSNKIITAEIIYNWMIELGIPFECEHWHIHSLMMLITVCAEKSSGAKKMMKPGDILSHNASLNAARRAKMHTRG